MTTQIERLVSIEVRLKKVEQNLEELTQSVGSIEAKITSSKGFIGGILFTVSAIGTVIGFLISYVIHGGPTPPGVH